MYYVSLRKVENMIGDDRIMYKIKIKLKTMVVMFINLCQ